MSDLHLDDSATWASVAKAAVVLGGFHATIERELMSDAEVFHQLTKTATVTYSRPFQARLLWEIYRATYQGTATVRMLKEKEGKA